MESEQESLTLDSQEIVEFNSVRNSFDDAAKWLQEKLAPKYGMVSVSGFGLYEFKGLQGASVNVLFNY